MTQQRGQDEAGAGAARGAGSSSIRPPHPRALHPWDEIPREALKPAHVYAGQRDWPGYFAAVAGKPARETLLKALELFESQGVGGVLPGGAARPGGFAVDLACGEGRDAAELLRHGWRVLAIDGHPEAIERIRHRTDISPGAPLRVEFAMMESCALPACDLLNASFALPFCEPGAFAGLWARIVGAIRPGGRLAGQFFGDRDSWATIPDRTHHTRDQVEGLLQPFEVEMFQEEEKDGLDAQQHAKHWHVFHVVARRRKSNL